MEIAKGKTKIIRKGPTENTVVMGTLDVLTGGDPTKQLDKQCFRDDYPLSQVTEKYVLVTQLTEQFR